MQNELYWYFISLPVIRWPNTFQMSVWKSTAGGLGFRWEKPTFAISVPFLLPLGRCYHTVDLLFVTCFSPCFILFFLSNILKKWLLKKNYQRMGAYPTCMVGFKYTFFFFKGHFFLRAVIFYCALNFEHCHCKVKM